MKKIIIVLAVLMLALAGCVTPPPVRISDLNKVTPLTGLPPLPVRCAAEVWPRVEDLKMMGMPFKFLSGEVFAATFNGTKADQPVIDVIDSSLTGKITDLGFTAHLNYKITVSFTANGVRHELKAEAIHAEHGFNGPATQAKIVVETAVADIYRQVKALLNVPVVGQ